MANKVSANYEEVMFGHFNTPEAFDDLMYLLDWDEMYSAVELPAAALLVPQGRRKMVAISLTSVCSPFLAPNATRQAGK